MPDDAVRKLSQDTFPAIIALTHDPRIDDMGLMEALQTMQFHQRDERYPHQSKTTGTTAPA